MTEKARSKPVRRTGTSLLEYGGSIIAAWTTCLFVCLSVCSLACLRFVCVCLFVCLLSLFVGWLAVWFVGWLCVCVFIS